MHEKRKILGTKIGLTDFILLVIYNYSFKQVNKLQSKINLFTTTLQNFKLFIHTYFNIIQQLMRPKLARITKLPKLETNPELPPEVLSPEALLQLNRPIVNNLNINRLAHYMESIDTFMKKSIRQVREFQLEARDRSVIVDLPQGDGEVDDENLQYWVTDVCNNVFSSAFHSLLHEAMSYEHIKIFCSEGILRNIVTLTSRARLTERQIRLIDDHIEEKIVPYMKRKYPFTESTDVNKAVDQRVKPIDNREAIQNDLLQKSEVVFTYRQDGNYNDLIMRFINWLINSLDSKAPNSTRTVYEQYYDFVSKLFENVYDENWMNIHVFPSDRDLGLSNRECKVGEGGNRELYKQQVKEYTHYAIGRKISKNVPGYSSEEIQSKHLRIKSPSVLRILTKWCQELWEKFSTKNYFLEREENVRVQQKEGNINTMFMWMKLPLNDLIEEQKAKIEAFMEEIQINNYDQQARLLLKELERDGFTHVERIEKACGKFAFKTVNNLHSYITLYLNRLIHGLLTASKILYETRLSSAARWTSPPDLITFKVGDLMRCKCSSKEREILKIFQEMESLSQRQPGLLKIVRVKNRLKGGTKDILINALFEGKYLCEFQLAVNTTRSKFIECSNMFSHYVYQLGRTPFGPLTELASVWMSLDPRADEYLEIIKNEKRTPTLDHGGCGKEGKKHEWVQLDRPFVCNGCNIAYSHSNYIWKHLQCIQLGCGYKICACCRIQSEEEEVLKQKLLKGVDIQLRKVCKGIVNRRSVDQILPTFGVCIQIESKQIRVQRFKKLEVNKIMTIFGIKEDKEVTLIEQLTKKDAERNFLKKYLIFSIDQKEGKLLIDITIDKAKKDYIIPKKVKEIYTKQKEILSLIEENLNDESVRMLQGSRDGMKHIKNMELADNKLTNITFISQNFPNLQRLQLSRNTIISIEGVSKLTRITKLNLRDNKLTALPDEITSLTLLEGLNIRHNQLTCLPNNFGNLRLLNKLESDNNKITHLPESFRHLTKLTFIDLSWNKLTVFPEAFKVFSKIKDLALANNSLGYIPEWIGDFKQLVTLDLARIKASNFPKSIFKLTTLEKLRIDSSEDYLSPEIGELAKLKDLWLQMSMISTIPQEIFRLGNLEQLGLEDCRMRELPDCLSQMRKLTSFSLINNHLYSLSNELTEMTRLKYLRIEKQNISTLPEAMNRLTNLRTLSLDGNRFTQLPEVVLSYSKLYTLTLRQNQIEKLPDDLFLKLPEIENFAVDENKLTELPSSLRSLKKLKKISYEKNPLNSEPPWLKDYKKKD